MKRLTLVITLWLACLVAWGQRAVGSWRQYRAYGNATACVVADGQVFTLASGNLFAYDPEAEELTTLDTQSGLSANGITHMAQDAATHTVMLVYADGTIDLIDSRTLEVTALTALRDKNMASKTVNAVSADGGRAWLFMSFGLVEIDLGERRFGETCEMGRDIVCGAEHDGVLYYCVKDDGMYGVQLDENLHDAAAHRRINSSVYTRMEPCGDWLYAMSSSTLRCLDPTKQMNIVGNVNDRFVNMQRAADGSVVAYTATKVVTADDKAQFAVAALPNDFKALARHGSMLWAARGLNGLQPFKMDAEGGVAPCGEAIVPNSPRYDYFYRMNYVGTRLLVAGGAHEYTAGATFEGTASLLDGDTWTNLDTVVIGREKYENITGIAQSPDSADVHYLTSMGHGLYVYRDGHMVQRFNHENSPLTTILPSSSHHYDYVRTSAPTFDAEGNLWLFNCEADTLLWRYTPRTGKWQGYHFEEIEGSRCPVAMYHDPDGRIWLMTRDVGGRGLMCYDPKARRHVHRSTITQQDGLSYSPDNFFCFAPDHDGQLWVGTDKGLFVIERPDEYMGSDFVWTQIKVNREDGSGLADYLMSGLYITCMAVDGGNRKWIGTLGSGIYLVSADGQETLEHFTAANSPLPSDNIRSVAVNPQTGEVMIGTEKGLASFMGSATEPEETLDKDNIVVYPNPVRPDYGGDVVIRGLASDCEVKVCSTGGQVVWAGTSAGGTATWNLQRRGGGRVATGVYSIVINTPDVGDVVVARLAVVN